MVSTIVCYVHPFFRFIQPKKVFSLYTDNIPELWEVTERMLKLRSISILGLLLLATICYPVFAVVGDVNGDGHVDGSDLAIVALAFGSYPGSPRWNPVADLNNDGVVDGADLTIVAINFGK
jgi:hypothetical protein